MGKHMKVMTPYFTLLPTGRKNWPIKFFKMLQKMLRIDTVEFFYF